MEFPSPFQNKQAIGLCRSGSHPQSVFLLPKKIRLIPEAYGGISERLLLFAPLVNKDNQQAVA
jgi:hypothetical protein